MRLLLGDCCETLKTLPEKSVQCCVTSPPYFGLRSYGEAGAEIGKEKTPAEFVASLVAVFREVRRVLKDDGTVWLNLGDSYVGATSQHKEGGSAGANSPISKKTLSGIPTSGRGDRNRALYAAGYGIKQLIGIPWRVAFALQDDDWILRQDIIWHKPNPMPESVRDRCTKAHEYIFLLAKKPKYYFDSSAMQEPAVTSSKDIARAKVTGRGEQAASANYLGTPQRDHPGGFPQRNKENPVRNRRSVWTVTTKPYKGAHFATFPPDLIEPCILAGSRPGDMILDPFGGSGTTAQVALKHGRQVTLCELYPEYAPLIYGRVGVPDFI